MHENRSGLAGLTGRKRNVLLLRKPNFTNEPNLNLTADVPCHNNTDSHYDSECDDVDEIFFCNLVICLWTCLTEIAINACRELWLKTENKYFETDFNINGWQKNVTEICPRMLENTSQRVSNFKFFPRTPPEGPQHAMLATQAQFTSAAYSVQIRHLLHFLITTLKKTSKKIRVLAHMRNMPPMQAML